MSSPAELGLYYKSSGFSVLPKSFADEIEPTRKVEEFLARLEEERLKIDAFKRELPLCMQLLNNAVEALRQQLETWQANQEPRPILEEFIPLKCSNSGLSEKVSDTSEKMNWLTSVQLWSQASEERKHKPAIGTTSVRESEQGFGPNPKLSLDNKERSGGAFTPFSRERRNENATRVLPELALASVDKEIGEKKCLDLENGMSNKGGGGGCGGGGGAAAEQGKGTTNTAESQAAAPAQTHRKARRCWSPDLHRRFVNALQMLGGSQVATPKQIRELMKVDGLTNDEVKSHLQKYRLHTRRPSPTTPSPAGQAPQLVVLGGIWVPPEYAAAHSAAASAIYGAHPGPAHYCAPPVPQDFYPAPPPQHHHYHSYGKASSHTHSSPESDDRAARERSESMEAEEEEAEEKSESGSWRGREKEGRVAKGLLSLRDSGEDEEESHGSGVSLKF